MASSFFKNPRKDKEIVPRNVWEYTPPGVKTGISTGCEFYTPEGSGISSLSEKFAPASGQERIVFLNVVVIIQLAAIREGRVFSKFDSLINFLVDLLLDL